MTPPPHDVTSQAADERRLPSTLALRRQVSREQITIKEYNVAPKAESYALRRKMLRALSRRLTTRSMLPHQDPVPGAAKHVRQEPRS